MIRGNCVYVVRNNSGTLGKPVIQLMLAEMPAYNSKKHASQKWLEFLGQKSMLIQGEKQLVVS